jgi:DNA topoisomerase-1
MEDKLDKISNGKMKWNTVLDNFYKQFHPNVVKLNNKVTNIQDDNSRLLGKDPDTDCNIYATIARYGPVVKLQDTKPRYAPIREPLTIDNITLNDALKLLSYPKLLGKYKRKNVILYNGKNGLYIKYNNYGYTVEGNQDINLEQAIELIQSKEKKSLATFKNKDKIYNIYNGPYGQYIQVTTTGKKKTKPLNVKLPECDIDKLTIDKINEIINNRFKYKSSNKGYTKKKTVRRKKK